jgi:hypothetical protein
MIIEHATVRRGAVTLDELHAAWNALCAKHGVNPRSKFVVFPEDDPSLHEYNALAMRYFGAEGADA